jgi:hypothetical protein
MSHIRSVLIAFSTERKGEGGSELCYAVLYCPDCFGAERKSGRRIVKTREEKRREGADRMNDCSVRLVLVCFV